MDKGSTIALIVAAVLAAGFLTSTDVVKKATSSLLDFNLGMGVLIIGAAIILAIAIGGKK